MLPPPEDRALVRKSLFPAQMSAEFYVILAHLYTSETRERRKRTDFLDLA